MTRCPSALTPALRNRLSCSRRGMTLMEVMIATLIVLGSAMALSRIAFLARRHALAAEDRSLAQIHCQNIAEEMLAGIRPLQNVSPTVFEGEQWVYMVEVEPIESTRLARITVTVDRLDDAEAMLPSEEEMSGYRLVRWVRLGDRTITDGASDMGLEPDGETGLEEEATGTIDFQPDA